MSRVNQELVTHHHHHHYDPDLMAALVALAAALEKLAAALEKLAAAMVLAALPHGQRLVRR